MNVLADAVELVVLDEHCAYECPNQWQLKYHSRRLEREAGHARCLEGGDVICFGIEVHLGERRITRGLHHQHNSEKRPSNNQRRGNRQRHT